MLREFLASQFKKPSGLLGIWSSNQMIKNNKKNYDRLFMDIDLQPGDKLLEIGYGPGIGIRQIAERCSSCLVHGIDFSHLMYTRASKYNKQFIEAGRVSLQHGDFLQMPITPNIYDKVFCLNVVYFWKELATPFTNVFSCLKKGGSFHLYMADKKTLVDMKTPDSVFSKHSIEQVVEALHTAGFESVNHETERGHYIKAKK
jgi:cyclopropane fatty-acyl-phospholipid synthase-like methyltransferase